MSRRSTLSFLLGAGLLIAACDDAPTEVLTEVEPEIVAVTPAQRPQAPNSLSAVKMNGMSLSASSV